MWIFTLVLTLVFLDVPSEADPVVGNAQAQAQICTDIIRSGFFCPPLKPEELSEFLLDSDDNANLWEFYLPHFHNFRDYVFECEFVDSSSRLVLFFHVSKQYNVGSFENTYMPGRFIIEGFLPRRSDDDFGSMILVEEPAIAYAKPDFNVELHYLQIREYVKPSRSKIYGI